MVQATARHRDELSLPPFVREDVALANPLQAHKHTALRGNVLSQALLYRRQSYDGVLSQFPKTGRVL